MLILLLIIAQRNLTMSNSFINVVPIFTGTNWVTWSEQMTDWLRSQSLWMIVNGLEQRPSAHYTSAIAATATTAGQDSYETEESVEARSKWDVKDDQALGTIRLRLSPDVKSFIRAYNTAQGVWNALEAKYGTPDNGLLFSDFQQVLRFRFSGGNPEPEMLKIGTLFSRLDDNDVKLPQFVKAMILVLALPTKWDSISATIAQMPKANITFDKVQNAITAEYHRQAQPKSHYKNTPQANKISAVKRKGDAPAWRETKKPVVEPATTGTTDNAKKPYSRRKRGSGKGKEHAKDGQSYDRSSTAASLETTESLFS